MKVPFFPETFWIVFAAAYLVATCTRAEGELAWFADLRVPAVANTDEIQSSEPGDVPCLGALRQQQEEKHSMGDLAGEAETLNSIARLEYNRSLFDEAIRDFAGALALFRGIGDRYGEARSLTEIGSIQLENGKWLDSLASYQQALPLWQRTDRSREATTLGKMAEAFRGLGDAHEAVRFDELALSAFVELGDKAGQAAVLNNIGLADVAAGNRKQGMKFFVQARDSYRQVENSDGEAATLNNIAVTYSLSGKQSDALAAFDQAFKRNREHGNRGQQASILANIGVVYAMLGKPMVAHEFYEKALSLYREAGDHRGEVRTSQAIAALNMQGRRHNEKHLDRHGTQKAETRLTFAH